ncbi:tripeptidyl-peptidase 1 [Nannizzia gypsea CBS 118893]|uniref:tripeptidyl-peptidase II n=1 Tax=Arthroderma gypseum (strain ATCC MYA-4604 / CBS 118893) TaxID=535722 RepID=E4UZU3_ARTGP|nr:tripeptidyl-peptidase 1 [Nannizzia gypsea CBS 118893]EFR02880.1 tripeptidyl-peptidase 1 [Nannizzia gypsea CBS 118893]
MPMKMLLRRYHVIMLLLLGVVVALPNTHRTIEELPRIPEGWVQGKPPSPDTTVRMNLALVQRNAHVFEQMVLDISTPGHRSYGKHLSRRDLKRLLRPRLETSDLVLSWLKDSGIPKRSIVNDGDWIHFVVSISQAEKMLKARFYHFHDLQDPRVSIIRTLNYSVPAHLVPHVYMVQPTTKFGKPTNYGKSIARLETIHPSSNSTKNCNVTITPKCLRELYKMGDHIAERDCRNVIGISGYLGQYARYSDFYKFIELYAPEIKDANFSVEHIGKGQNLQNSTRNSIEASLDIDYALGLSNASAVFYTTGGRGPLVPDLDQPDQEHNSNEPYLDQLLYLLGLPQEKLPAVLSTSYGENEQSVPEREFPVLIQRCPFVTSVGATFRTNPEQAIDFSSGGFSDRHSRPRYQIHAVQSYLDKLGVQWEGLYNPRGRGIPDVSAQGANFAVYDHGKVMMVSGTRYQYLLTLSVHRLLHLPPLLPTLMPSACAPTSPVLGYLNPFIYGKGRKGFTDIVYGGSKGCIGDNSAGGTAPIVPYASWNATEGWDPVTGLGTPNFQILAKIVQHME